MKRLLLFSVLFSSSIIAQNWSPVSLADKYNYRLDNDTIVTATIGQEGFSSASGDTIFSLSTVMCDTCLTWNGGPNSCPTCYGQLHVGQFTGKQLKKMSSGWCNFRSPGSKTINLFASISNSWLYDTTANVTAQVIFSGTGTVLGNSDSLKTLLLSTGDTLRFSKNYGIVQWPNGYGQNSYYRLVGIHGRNIGVLVPRMVNYFDFAIGDIFEYHGHKDCGCSPQLSDFTRKYIITGKTVSGDTLRYTVQGHEASFNQDVFTWNTWWSYYIINDTYTFIDSVNHFGNMFNHNAVDGNYRVIENSGGMGWSYYTVMNYAPAYYRTQLFIDSSGYNGIRFGNASYVGQFMINPSGSTPVYTGSDTLQPEQWTDAFTIELTDGLGQTFGHWTSNFEGSWSEKLAAYRKNGDTVGVFTPDNYLDAVLNSGMNVNGFAVYPNPANEIINVQSQVGENTTLQLFDLQGRSIRSVDMKAGTAQLQVSDIESGLYVLLIETRNGTMQQKVMISH